MSMGTLLCFDYGLKSIGVAVGQSITATASPLNALSARDGVPDWNQVEALINEWQPSSCIVGMPLNMDGTEQPISERARTFANRLNGRFKINVELWDERLTTVDAKAELFALGGFKKLDKGKIDSVSACIILQSYFDNNA
ncbi:Holliday junction resolvase RuvX [Alteromonas facilis]|uniref:Holliday junction resolvase RuvX n=1 Tax=Alteromonas facilis TaxID=2048004 RepID=UPI000C29365A|nr:Holliday junction resolvase RuvX [Alteromonas facilis]